MFYTVMPIETVLQGYEDHQPIYTELPCTHGTLLVEQLSINCARVIRLISSNPLDYLEPALQPGRIIQFTAQTQATF